MESQTIVNKVEFQAVRNSYPLNQNVYCYFTVPTTGSMKPVTGDWVGIYKVGWTSLKEYQTKKMVMVEGTWGKQEPTVPVVFEFETLPKETEQYYQFVYVKNGEFVKGVSKPFFFVEMNTIVEKPERFIRQQGEQIKKQTVV